MLLEPNLKHIGFNFFIYILYFLSNKSACLLFVCVRGTISTFRMRRGDKFITFLLLDTLASYHYVARQFVVLFLRPRQDVTSSITSAAASLRPSENYNSLEPDQAEKWPTCTINPTRANHCL